MPRYIDADLFLEKMKKTNRYFDVKFDIEEMPTVDVVTKGEVQELIKSVDNMLDLVCAMTGLELTYYGKYAELKKKYEVKRR